MEHHLKLLLGDFPASHVWLLESLETHDPPKASAAPMLVAPSHCWMSWIGRSGSSLGPEPSWVPWFPGQVLLGSPGNLSWTRRRKGTKVDWLLNPTEQWSIMRQGGPMRKKMCILQLPMAAHCLKSCSNWFKLPVSGFFCPPFSEKQTYWTSFDRLLLKALANFGYMAPN